MSSVSQINYIVEQLEEKDRLFVLQMLKNFLPYAIPSEEDLHHINLAKEEYLNGETVSLDSIEWD